MILTERKSSASYSSSGMRTLAQYRAAASGSVISKVPCKFRKNLLVNPALTKARKVRFLASSDHCYSRVNMSHFKLTNMYVLTAGTVTTISFGRSLKTAP